MTMAGKKPLAAMERKGTSPSLKQQKQGIKIKNRRRQDVASGDGKIGWGAFRFRFLDQFSDAQQSFAERRLRSWFAIHDAVKMGLVLWDFFDGNGADAGSLIDLDELFGGGIRTGD